MTSTSHGRRSDLLDSQALPVLAAWGVVVFAVMQPDFYSNEHIYLPRGRRLLDPSVLAEDWMLGSSEPTGSLSILFDALVATLWSVLGDGYRVAYAARLLAWTVLVPAVALFATHLGSRGLFFLSGFIVFLAAGQGFAAGEWLFIGAEQKCFAYAALLFAIDRAIRGRLTSAGVLTGLSVAFHVLVGGWGGTALGIALFLNARRVGAAGLLRFGLAAGVVSLPVLVLGFRYLGAPGPEVASGLLAERFVLFKNPHHLDPEMFLSFKRAVLFIALVVTTCWIVRRTAAPAAVRLILPFLLVLALFYLAGIAARDLELFGFLKYYPFRTGDVLLPLAFSLVAPGALVSGVRARGPGRLRGCLPAIAVATIAALFVYSRQDRFVEFFAQLGEQGQRILQGEFAPVSALGPTARWIREHSPRDSVFATDPCLDEFWLETERAMVVNAMSAPANAHFFEWYARMRDLNGGREFAESSFSVCREIRPHFASLSAESLQALRARYGADYYLVESERPDLAGAQVFHTDRFFVYALPRLEPGGASSD